MAQALSHQPVSGIGHDGSTRVADQRHLRAFLELNHQFRRARQFIVGVIADQLLVNRVVLQQLLRLPRILARDQVRFLQHAQRPQRNILEVADRRRHQIEASRRRIVLHVRHRCFPHRSEFNMRLAMRICFGLDLSGELERDRVPGRSSC